MSEPGEQHNGDTRLPFCPFLRALGYEPFTYRCRLICTLVQSCRPNQSCVRHPYLHTNSKSKYIRADTSKMLLCLIDAQICMGISVFVTKAEHAVSQLQRKDNYCCLYIHIHPLMSFSILVFCSKSAHKPSWHCVTPCRRSVISSAKKAR